MDGNADGNAVCGHNPSAPDVVVVVGHWLAASVTYQEGHFVRDNVLGQLPWTQWLTWIFQVVPVFFLVAGYASAASWTGRDGKRLRDWLVNRLRAALGSTTAYVVVVLSVVGVLVGIKVDSTSLALSAWAVAMHLWFIPVYLVLVALTPIAVGAHRRWGLLVPAVLGIAVAAVDAVSLSGLVPGLRWAANLLCWAAVYQIGVAWYFGAVRSARPLVLAIAAAFVVALEIGFGPYSVSLIGVPGQVVQNSAPPSIVMLAFGMVQAGLLIAIAPTVTRWLRGSPLQHPLAIANRRVMLLYLWHMIAVVLLALAAYPTGLFPQPVLGSTTWWLSRLLWVALLSMLTAGVLSLIGWGHPMLAASLGTVRVGLPVRWSTPIVLVGTGLAAATLWRFAADSFAPQGRFPLWVALLFACGVALVTARPTRTHRSPVGSTVTARNTPKRIYRRPRRAGSRCLGATHAQTQLRPYQTRAAGASQSGCLALQWCRLLRIPPSRTRVRCHQNLIGCVPVSWAPTTGSFPQRASWSELRQRRWHEARS